VKFAHILGGIAMAITVASAPAHAAIVYTGSTTGCFSGCGVDSNFLTSVSDSGGLNFVGRTFTGQAGPTLDLGTLSLQATKDVNPVSDDFLLKVVFSEPGSGSSTFDAVLTGSINHGSQGNVLINFGSAQTVSFSGGSFSLLVDDITLNADNIGDPITGHISSVVINPAVPEASTWAMMILGFAGIGFFAYRKRKNGLALAAA
jgi:PEP-CTERM motif